MERLSSMTIHPPAYHILLSTSLPAVLSAPTWATSWRLLYLFDAHLDQVGKEIFGALRWRRSGDYSMHGRKETLRATTRVQQVMVA